MSRKSLILAAITVAVLIVGFIVYLELGHSDSGYLTIAELKARDTSGRQIRVKGEVAAGSVRWDARQQIMRFALTDGDNTLDTLYRGVVPDNFKPGAKLVVEGSYSASGMFEARSISSGNSRFCAICH